MHQYVVPFCFAIGPRRCRCKQTFTRAFLHPFNRASSDAVVHGSLDVAFLRAEELPGIEIKVVSKEPLVAISPQRSQVGAT